MNVLDVLPAVTPRKEQVDVPEWGGAVIVRGLLASEVFAVKAQRQDALRRLRVRRAPGGEGAEPAEPVDLEFNELRDYGRYQSELLARAVVGRDGVSLYTVDDWESATQQWPAVVSRLLDVAERLSGMHAEDVEKNSPPSPSTVPSSTDSRVSSFAARPTANSTACSGVRWENSSKYSPPPTMEKSVQITWSTGTMNTESKRRSAVFMRYSQNAMVKIQDTVTA